MAIQSGFFNSVNGDRRYDAKWFAQYFASFIANGVFPNPSTGLQVMEGDNMTTVVKVGKGWINGYFIVNDSDYVLQHDNADGVLKRIDRVVMRLNNLTRQIEIAVKKGNFASSPVAPSLQRDGDCYELALADVLINNGTTQITQANITDARLNKELCGIVHGVVNQVDTTTIFNQYQAWFNSVKDGTEGEIEAWQQEQYAQFEAWFATIQNILDGDVAANLANHIVALENKSMQVDSEFYRLAKQTNSSQREIAYLKLKQDAADRIENGTTFANDFKGNAFGIVFNGKDSVNAVVKNGGIVMVESTEQTYTANDVAVVNQAYDTSGNNGRKIVRLKNGWLVAVVSDLTNKLTKFYISKNQGTTFSFFGEVGLNVSFYGGIALATDGINVYVLRSGYYDTLSAQVGFFVIRNFEQFTVEHVRNIDTGQIAVESCILAINETGTELHATWASKNQNYSNSFNIRYAKGVINADGSVTWGAVEQVTKTDNASISYTHTLTIDKNNEPTILLARSYSSDSPVHALKKSGLSQYPDYNWTYAIVYGGSSYQQRNPSVIYVPPAITGTQNGRIWVAWNGRDSANPNTYNIFVSFSDDFGVSWSNPDKLTNGDVYHQESPSITANNNNEIFVVWTGQTTTNATSDNRIKQIKWSKGIWGGVKEVKGPAALFPSTIYDVNMNFSEPLFIYQDVTNKKIGFYGSWGEISETPTLTATATFDVGDTDFIGVFVQKQGDVAIQAYFNDKLMDSELDGNEYQFTKQLPNEAPATLRLELSRTTVDGGNGDKITRILGGIA